MVPLMRNGGRSRIPIGVVPLLALVLCLPLPAQAALSCSLSGVSTLDFGAPSPLDAGSSDVAPSFTVTCTADLRDLPGRPGSTRSANLCVSYDNGTGGPSAGGNRLLTGAGGNALFDLYPTAAYGPTHWGARSGAPTGIVVQAFAIFTKPSGRTVAPASASVTPYARLFGGQNLLPPGIYASTLTVTVEAFWSDVKGDCGAGGTVLSTASSPQTATVAYRNECRAGTIPDLDFGTIGFLTANLDALTTVSVTCTAGTPYRIGLDAGTSAGATASSRRLTGVSPPNSQVGYGLYRDSARTQPWGNDTATGADTQNGSGTGAAAGYTIYGRVPPQDTPQPGDYRDTIVLAVVF